ncbi:MAG: HPr family phosphocarrier protein [Oscillospiraceae bacterium]|nr:HPr family phosphocarrier protein [Oscillospiraceae bacterium]
MKNQTTVMLPAINDVKNFVSEVTLCDYDVDLISGRYAVDAKSIMGIFSLDLSKPIKLEAQTDDASELFERIKQYIVE